MLVRDVMTSPVQTVRPDAWVQQAADLMSHFNVGALPVCLGGVLIGIITDRDVVLRCIGLRARPDEMPVVQAMTREPFTVDAQEPIEAAAHKMGMHGYRRLPVLDEGRLVGIVSANDIALYLDAFTLGDMFRQLASRTQDGLGAAGDGRVRESGHRA